MNPALAPDSDTIPLELHRAPRHSALALARAPVTPRRVQRARVRLPDATDQDVELTRGASGELLARLIDGDDRITPMVKLDFSEGATPQVTWAPDCEVPLATSLEVVAKVCAALARAASEQGLPSSAEPAFLPPSIEPAANDAIEIDAELVPATPSRAGRLLVLQLVAGTCVTVAAALLPFRDRTPTPPVSAPIAAPIPASKPSAPEPRPVVAPAIPAPVIAPTPVPAPTPVVHAHRGAKWVARSERHHVKGLAPSTGLVALRTQPGIEVAVDGLWVGMTPVRPQVLTEGSHVLELRRSAKAKQVLDLEVTAGDQVTLFLTLE